jgi:hypothetical protein
MTREQLMKDFHDWSGGFTPDECTDDEITVYLDYACPTTIQREIAEEWLRGG